MVWNTWLETSRSSEAATEEEHDDTIYKLAGRYVCITHLYNDVARGTRQGALACA